MLTNRWNLADLQPGSSRPLPQGQLTVVVTCARGGQPLHSDSKPHWCPCCSFCIHSEGLMGKHFLLSLTGVWASSFVWTATTPITLIFLWAVRTNWTSSETGKYREVWWGSIGSGCGRCNPCPLPPSPSLSSLCPRMVRTRPHQRSCYHSRLCSEGQHLQSLGLYRRGQERASL